MRGDLTTCIWKLDGAALTRIAWALRQPGGALTRPWLPVVRYCSVPPEFNQSLGRPGESGCNSTGTAPGYVQAINKRRETPPSNSPPNFISPNAFLPPERYGAGGARQTGVEHRSLRVSWPPDWASGAAFSAGDHTACSGDHTAGARLRSRLREISRLATSRQAGSDLLSSC